MFERFGAWVDRLDQNGPGVKDIPMIAALILVAIIVIGGEIICCLWAIACLFMALFNGVSSLLMLIPCLILLSTFTSIIVVVYWKVVSKEV